MTIEPVTIVYLLLQIWTAGEGTYMKSEDIITHRTSQIGIFSDLKMCDEKLLAYATEHNINKSSYKYEIKEDIDIYPFGFGKWVANHYLHENFDNRLFSTLKCIPVELKTSDKKKFYKEK